MNIEGWVQHKISQLMAEMNALGIEAAVSVQWRTGNVCKNTTGLLTDGPEQARTLLIALAKDADAEAKKVTSLATVTTPPLIIPGKG